MNNYYGYINNYYIQFVPNIIFKFLRIHYNTGSYYSFSLDILNLQLSVKVFLIKKIQFRNRVKI